MEVLHCRVRVVNDLFPGEPGCKGGRKGVRKHRIDVNDLPLPHGLRQRNTGCRQSHSLMQQGLSDPAPVNQPKSAGVEIDRYVTYLPNLTTKENCNGKPERQMLAGLHPLVVPRQLLMPE